MENLELLLGHLHDRGDHGLEALLLLEDYDGLGRVVLRGEQHVGGELLAAEARAHHPSAKVGMVDEVAQDALRDVDLMRVDGHAAAVGAVVGPHIVDVGVLGQ